MRSSELAALLGAALLPAISLALSPGCDDAGPTLTTEVAITDSGAAGATGAAGAMGAGGGTAVDDGSVARPGASNALDAGAALDGGDADASTSVTRALDGQWNVVTLPPSFFGASIVGGSFTVDDGTYSFAFVHGDVGTPVPDRSGGPCTIASHTTTVSITILGAYGSGTVSDLTVDQGSGCDSTALKEITLSQIDIAQSSALPATVTPYDGTWSVTLTDPNDPNDPMNGVPFTVSISRDAWSIPTTAPLFGGAQGSVVGTITVATDDTADFAAQRQ